MFAVLHLTGLIVAMALAVRDSGRSTDLAAERLTVLEAIQVTMVLSVIDTVVATLLVNLLWTYGKRRGPVGFRIVALLVFVLVGSPVQACISASTFDTAWAAVTAIMVVIVRRPRPAVRVLPAGTAPAIVMRAGRAPRRSARPYRKLV
ncbi:hypothetical protein [Actinoplanes octamycinicus]|uniref:hypothetical protein n=1 Tax=Actinoplanes octamycinicus TaxID=135948 RepID=UPI0019424090|nr:hypothetical protein [Actinoplanes octamycinicus]